MNRPLEILLVEDNYADVRWLQILLADARFPHILYVARDGEEALEFLNRGGRYLSAPDPDMVVIDLNLPRVTGVEILQSIRAHEKLRETPVCVLSGSPLERAAILPDHNLDVRCYMVKPITREAFVDALNTYPRLKPFLEAWRGSGAHGG